MIYKFYLFYVPYIVTINVLGFMIFMFALTELIALGTCTLRPKIPIKLDCRKISVKFRESINLFLYKVCSLDTVCQMGGVSFYLNLTKNITHTYI